MTAAELTAGDEVVRTVRGRQHGPVCTVIDVGPGEVVRIDVPLGGGHSITRQIHASGLELVGCSA